MFCLPTKRGKNTEPWLQEMIYTCNMDQEDELRKKEVQVMGEWRTEEKVGQGDTRKFSDIKILISKDLPITGFPHLDLIDVGYYIHAVAKVNLGSLFTGDLIDKR